MELTRLVVPNIGDLRDVTIIEILVRPGDVISADQDIVTIESEKSAMQIGATAGGVVTRLLVQLGDTVNEGSELAELEPRSVAQEAAVAATPAAGRRDATSKVGEATAKAPDVMSASSADPAVSASSTPHAAPAVSASSTPHASPSVRRVARELGVSLATVSGTGPRGRITREDVQRHIQKAVHAFGRQATPSERSLSLAPWPEVDFASFGAVDRQPLSRIQKLSGANLARNWALIPHVTNHDEADITELESFRHTINEDQRTRGGTKVTALAFVIKSVAAALKAFPAFNASLAADELVLKRYYNVGVAVDTPKGLLVPVVRDVDQKGILALAMEIAALAELARNGKLTPQHMQGGTFSVSSLGGIGGTGFTPIINAPEVAILGVSRASMRPVWDGRDFRPRLMLPLSLSYDHRAIDGVAAAHFNAYLGQLLSDFRRVSL